jgi:hypothetical protein
MDIGEFNVFHDPEDAEKRFDSYVESAGLRTASEFPKYWQLKDGQSSLIYFIKDPERGLKPLTFSQHYVWDSDSKQGQGGYAVLTCTANGNGDQPNLMNAWLVPEVYPTQTVIRIMSQNAKFSIAKQLNEYLKEMDLSQKMIKITKHGKGKYTIIPQQGVLPPYDPKQLIKLKEYFGMDQKRYAKMQRIAEEIKRKNEQKAGGESRQSELDNPGSFNSQTIVDPNDLGF